MRALLLLALSSLLLGLWTGLTRLGWNLNVADLHLHHGGIMVGGFLGTLISLEKVIPLKKGIYLIAPLLSASSVAAFAVGYPAVSFMMLMMASSALTIVFAVYFFREKNMIYILMLAGSLCWLIGNALLLSRNFYPLAFPWWLAFALLVITAERLELMKFLPVTQKSKYGLLLLLAAYILGATLSFHGTGRMISGGALVAISVWLMRHDIIRVSMRKSGLPSFVAFALSCGYVAMLLSGVFFIALDGHAMAYDAIVHTFFIGFVFSMIFAHGPIILPGVLGVAARPWHPILYAWLLLLHFSWVLRVAGDLMLDFQIRKFSGIISAIAIVLYFVSIGTQTIKSLRRHEKIL